MVLPISNREKIEKTAASQGTRGIGTIAIFVGRLSVWIALFIFAVGAGACFTIAALVLQSARQPAGQLDSSALARSLGSSTAPSLNMSASLAASPALLLRRMRSLHLNPDEVRRADPVVFQELASRCNDCSAQAQCMSDLAGTAVEEAGEIPRDSWRDYCPNGAMLNTLRTLHDCCETTGAGALSPA